MTSKPDAVDRVELEKFDVPFSALKQESRIELFGNVKMTLEGVYTIMEYSTEFLKIKIKRKYISIEGKDLQILNICAESFVLTGVIHKIELT